MLHSDHEHSIYKSCDASNCSEESVNSTLEKALHYEHRYEVVLVEVRSKLLRKRHNHIETHVVHQSKDEHA